MISGSSSVILTHRVMLAGDDDISGALRPIGLRILPFHKQELHIHIPALLYIPLDVFFPLPLSSARLSVSS